MSHLHRMFHKQQCQTVSVLNRCQQWNSIHTNIKKVKISDLRFNGIKGYTSYFIQTSLFYLQMKIISGTSEAGRTTLPYFLRTWNTRWHFLQLYKHISHKTGPRKQLHVTLSGLEMNISLWCSTFCCHNTSSRLYLAYFENTTLLFSFWVFFTLFSLLCPHCSPAVPGLSPNVWP